MTEPFDQPGWLARTFTRARVLSVHMARIPFGDKTFDLPVVLNRTQLSVAAIGALLAMLAFGVGSVFGVAAWTTWPVVILTLVAVVGLGLSSAPDRGAMLYLEGYARTPWAALPFTSTVSSSRRRPPRRRAGRYRVDMVLHPPVDVARARPGGGR